MSRPASVEDLISSSLAAAKPRFLSKKQRERARKAPKQIEHPPSVSKQESTPAEDADSWTPLPSAAAVKRRKLPSSKYAFQWDLDEDTSASYQPLISVETPQAPTDNISREKHWAEKALAEMSPRDWRIFKDEFNITTKGDDIQNPLRNWSEEKLLPSQLLDILLYKIGYKEPTPIQRAAIPLALRNRDVVGVAETGSGKTLAYLLPVLTYLLNIETLYMEKEHSLEANNNRALALILAPTRELALQITSETEKFTRHLGLSVVTIIGGHRYEETIHSLRNGVHIVVATPGRMVDSLERGIVRLDKCYHLTMDEADKMIDMGFEKSLQHILQYLPSSKALQSSIDTRIFGLKKRSCLMFTATISPAIEKITANYLTQPAYLYIGTANEVVDNIEQHFDYFGASPSERQEIDNQRLSRLIKILETHRRKAKMSVIVFANYKRVVELLAEELSDKNFGPVAVVHGSKSQEARERAIEAFRSREASILIATDVAARGLDVPHVSLVVNYQMSLKFEEYIHRIGRTGRAGQKGESYTFIDDSDSANFNDLKKFLSKGGYKLPDWLYQYRQQN